MPKSEVPFSPDTNTVFESGKAKEDNDTEDENGIQSVLPPVHYHNYYDNPSLESLLRFYQEVLKEKKSKLVQIPVGAIKFCQSLRELSGNNPLLCLLADKAYTNTHEFRRKTPDLEIHGCFSVIANLHALGVYFQQNGGFALLHHDEQSDFKVAAFISAPTIMKRKNVKDSQVGETDSTSAMEYFNEFRFSFKNNVEEFGPDHFFVLWKSIKSAAFPSHILNMLRLSDHDPDVFYKYRNTLEKDLDSSIYRDETIEELKAMWKNYYPNCPSAMDDVPFALGSVMLACDEYKDALKYFKFSLKFHGEHEATYFNIGLSLERMKKLDRALECYKQSMEFNPKFGRAKIRYNRLLNKIKQRNERRRHRAQKKAHEKGKEKSAGHAGASEEDSSEEEDEGASDDEQSSEESSGESSEADDDKDEESSEEDDTDSSDSESDEEESDEDNN